MTYVLKNKLLEHIGDWAIDKYTLEAVKKTWPIMEKFYADQGHDDPEIVIKPEEVLREVFTYPIFSEAFCKILKDEIENIKNSAEFIPNADEDELRQIPEFVLHERAPEFFTQMENVIKSIVNPILWSLWQRTVSHTHIQLANYNPKGKKKGAWHHDHSSDMTIVVPLNTGDYKGGGTEFFGRGIVGPLPNGHGLFFPAFTHLHRGLAVDEGDRYLMVIWLKGDVDEE